MKKKRKEKVKQVIMSNFQGNASETIEGILIVDKPKGKTAFSLISRLRKHLGVKKIGHAGTLDPFATGVMVLLIGKKYTRMSDNFLNHDKEYLAEVKLGIETDSYDCDGEIVSSSEYIPSLEEVKEAIKTFQGTIEQVPPMFSAKKINGKKLYELARQGKTIERKAVCVHLSTELLSYTYPFIHLKVKCSKGTYIRSIAYDLGKILTCGAHLTNLRRTLSGSFNIESSFPGEQLYENELNVHLPIQAI